MTGRWLAARPVDGYYSAYMEFEDGTPATIMHNGYGYFTMSSLYPWVDTKRGYDDAQRVQLRRATSAGRRDEVAEKEEFRIGGRRDPTATAAQTAAVPYPWKPFSLGPIEVACERGLMRPAQWGVSLHDDDGGREIDLRPLQRPEADLSGGLTLAIVEELYSAVVLGKPAFHTAEWGRATLEATLAVIDSARERREITLRYQVAMPDSYDVDLPIEPLLASPSR